MLPLYGTREQMSKQLHVVVHPCSDTRMEFIVHTWL